MMKYMLFLLLVISVAFFIGCNEEPSRSIQPIYPTVMYELETFVEGINPDFKSSQEMQPVKENFSEIIWESKSNGDFEICQDLDCRLDLGPSTRTERGGVYKNDDIIIVREQINECKLEGKMHGMAQVTSNFKIDLTTGLGFGWGTIILDVECPKGQKGTMSGPIFADVDIEKGSLRVGFAARGSRGELDNMVAMGLFSQIRSYLDVTVLFEQNTDTDNEVGEDDEPVHTDTVFLTTWHKECNCDKGLLLSFE